MFPQTRPFPQLLVSPAQSEDRDTEAQEEEDSETITPGLVTETESNVVINNNIRIILDKIGFWRVKCWLVPDHKMKNILCGIQSHSCTFPCVICKSRQKKNLIPF